MSQDFYYATGKRKTSVARVWLKQGSGKVTINNRDIDDYFKLESAKILLKRPVVLTDNSNAFDINVTVKGGGVSGQAGAICHGIAKALAFANSDIRADFRKAGLITRDPRIKERKKYGQKSARARYQFSKR